MLIPNITTEFKDSNGTLRVVWDMRCGDSGLNRSVFKIKRLTFRLFNEFNISFDAFDIVTGLTIEKYDNLCRRLVSWAATQTIEQLKAKLAF